MPHTSHRIDVVVVSVEPELEILETAFDGLRQRWEDGGLLTGDDVGDDPNGLIQGGFMRLWLDVPGRVVLYANQQGGFKVVCPRTGRNMARQFQEALMRWRSGGDRSLSCEHCSDCHLLEHCEMAPPGAFGSTAIVFSDAADIRLTERASSDIREAIGAFKVILRRTV